MSCCDKNRSELFNGQEASNNIPIALANRTPIIVEYQGKDQLTLRGTVSQKDYQFTAHGERMMIDPLDIAVFKNHLKIEILSKL